MNETNQELRDIIAEYGLTWRQAAEMTMVQLTSLERYMAPEKKGRKANPGFRALPAFRLKLLLNEIQRQQIKKIAE